jgi:magnesium and cobalt transporter
MSETPPERTTPGLLERLTARLLREPDDRDALLDLLQRAHERRLMDADALSIIEGALGVSDMAVRDIMVPRAQMDVIDATWPIERIVRRVVDTAHSRFPVIGQNKDDVQGILLAKELLRHYLGAGDFDLTTRLRPAVFVPEAQRVNVLLKEFRASRNHMAIVVDEYGGVAGLVTIEDVLEQIVGEIDDEFDGIELDTHIVRDNAGRYRVKATTDIADINACFGTQFGTDTVNTFGGLVTEHLGHLPLRGAQLDIGPLRIRVLRADSRRVHTLLVTPNPVRHIAPEADDLVGG